ncbi:MAG: RraA family protein [Planctomycetota bacterium]|jgi:regulator of RNase E activity RraA|nr:MAG: RraA family protein [Planctomycetota bacterium]
MNAPRSLSLSDLLQLKRWNTPTIYNGWEQITKQDHCADAVNLEETRDFMPQMGPMVGYAVTLKVEPSNGTHRKTKPTANADYRRYLASVPGPKIVVVQDMDKPRVIGSFWGEVNANVHKALGCVGTITDGAIRDVDEMTNAGLKAIARRLCVGHAAVQAVEFNCDVEVFGRKVSPGDLIHADKHGFIVIRPDEQAGILEASRFMDTNECETVIAAARNTVGLSYDEILANMAAASAQFAKNATAKFQRGGEW